MSEACRCVSQRARQPANHAASQPARQPTLPALGRQAGRQAGMQPANQPALPAQRGMQAGRSGSQPGNQAARQPRSQALCRPAAEQGRLCPGRPGPRQPGGSHAAKQPGSQVARQPSSTAANQPATSQPASQPAGAPFPLAGDVLHTMAPRRRAVALAPRHGRLRRLAPRLLENDRGDDVVHRLNLVCWGKSWGLDIWRPEPSRLLGWPGLAASCRRLCGDLQRSKVGPDPGNLKNLAF